MEAPHSDPQQLTQLPVAQLNEHFGIPGALAFEDSPAGTVARVTTPAATATLYLQGAHLAEWTPAGQRPVLFLSPRTELAPGKAIRGGVPVIFPWFGPRSDGKPGPSHGFARTSDWQLAFAALSGSQLELTLTLAPSQASRELGYDHFALAYRVSIGQTLTLELTVANQSDEPLLFEEALHTYFSVADVERASITGLAGTTYLDKRDEMKRKIEPEGPLTLTRDTDRVYLDTSATCVIDDVAAARHITVAKQGSSSTVVWNPWSVLTPGLKDMEPEGWRTMLCVETANVDADRITLAPRSSHTMRVEIAVEDHATKP